MHLLVKKKNLGMKKKKEYYKQMKKEGNSEL